MRYSIGLAAAGLLWMAATAHAEVTATVTAVSDYDFRGVSLSSKDPALQASVDFAAANGFYAGAWASNLDYGPGVDGNIELDLYVGWAGETSGGLGYDFGLVWYTYPDSSSYVHPVFGTIPSISDYPEIYAGIAYGPVEFKQWYSDDYVGSSLDSLYSELNGSFELPKDFTLNLHIGYNYGDAFEDFEYVDFSAGFGYTAGHFDLNLKYTGTELSESDVGLPPGTNFPDLFNPEPRVVFSVSTTFPWSAGGE